MQHERSKAQPVVDEGEEGAGPKREGIERRQDECPAEDGYAAKVKVQGGENELYWMIDHWEN